MWPLHTWQHHTPHATLTQGARTIHRELKNAKPNQQKVNYTRVQWNKYDMNIALLKYGLQVMASWWLNTMLKMSTLTFHVGITGDSLLVPYFFATTGLTGVICYDFLWDMLTELLQDMYLQTRIHLWFMHDDALSHFLLAGGELLKVFLWQWMEWDGPTAWPVHPPYLNSFDYYLWWHLKPTICATDISDVQDWQPQDRVDLRW